MVAALLTFIVFHIFPVFAQVDSLLLKSLERKLNRSLPESFFIIQATTALTPYSNAQQILFNLKDIRRYQLSPYVLYLWKDGLPVGEEKLGEYFEKNFYLKPDDKTFIIVSDSLYKKFYRPGWDVHLYYYHEGKQFLNANGKYEGIPEKPLPYHLLKINTVEEFQFSDSVYRHDNLECIYPLSDSLAITIAEDHFSPVRLVRLPDGKVLNVFKPGSATVKKWIFTYQNSRGYSWEEISRGVDALDTVRRSSFRPFTVYLKDSIRCFLVGCLGMYIQNRDKKIYTPTPFPKTPYWKNTIGDLVQECNDFFIQLNRKTLQVEKVFFMDNHIKKKFFRTHFLEPNSGLFIENDTFYIYGYRHNSVRDKDYPTFFKRNRNPRFVHVFRAEGETLRFVRTLPPRLVRSFEELYHAAPKYYFFKINDKGLFLYNQYYPEIYHARKSKPVHTWVPDSKNLLYKIPGYYDTTGAVIPFYSFRPFLIGGGRFLAVMTIQNHTEIMLSIFLPDFTEVQKIRLNDYLPLSFLNAIWDMEDGHYFLTERYIYFYRCFRNSGCKLLRIKYSLNPVNNECIWLKSSFNY